MFLSERGGEEWRARGGREGDTRLKALSVGCSLHKTSVKHFLDEIRCATLLCSEGCSGLMC